MYAIIETGGKQYRVETGSLVQVESLPGEIGGTIEMAKFGWFMARRAW